MPMTESELEKYKWDQEELKKKNDEIQAKLKELEDKDDAEKDKGIVFVNAGFYEELFSIGKVVSKEDTVKITASFDRYKKNISLIKPDKLDAGSVLISAIN